MTEWKYANEEAARAENESRFDQGDRIRLASDFKLRRVKWLWLGRIPRGKITMHDGDPGRGKSLMYVTLAAHVTKGRRLPGNAPSNLGGMGARGVVLVCAEDDWEDTILPRLMAADADLTKVATVLLDRDPITREVVPLEIPRDLRHIRSAIERVDAVMVAIDPIMAYLGSDTNSHNDASVRRALTPLKEMAEETGAATLLVRHLNKSGDLKAEYRGGGSIGFTALARSALVSEAHPTEEGVMVLAQIKSNLAVRAPAITYKIESTVVEVEDDDVIEVPMIKFGEEIDITADQLLGKHDSRKDAPAREACWSDMQDLFAEQPEWEVEEIKKKLRKAGHSDATIRRSADDNVTKTKRIGADGRIAHWVWSLPLNGTHWEPAEEEA